ncbi:hypothetical protein [Streptomyces sp. NPDC052496]|uniref:hypothetical protein n=1 Tax=Streptomyces sp. NPDC052496 TaxID=3154951 RepID=UPI0034345630
MQSPLAFAGLALAFVCCLIAYGIRRMPARDVRPALRTAIRALTFLTIGCLALSVVEPADVPHVLRAVMSKL